MSLVVDASVVIKWFIEEPLHEEARRFLLDGEVLHAPDLLISEVGNITWKLLSQGKIEDNQASHMVSSLIELPVTLHSSTELISRAVQLAVAIKHPVYDCLYLACAEALSCRLVTADKKLKKALSATSWSNLCWVLGDNYDISLSAEQIEQLLTLLDKAKTMWLSLPGSDVELHLRNPMVNRLKNAVQDLSESQLIDLLALGQLGSGRAGRDWRQLQLNARNELPFTHNNDLIDLVMIRSSEIAVGWRQFQKRANAASKS